MRWSGVLTTLVGVWVIAQVSLGDALDRLGLTQASQS